MCWPCSRARGLISHARKFCLCEGLSLLGLERIRVQFGVFHSLCGMLVSRVVHYSSSFLSIFVFVFFTGQSMPLNEQWHLDKILNLKWEDTGYVTLQ